MEILQPFTNFILANQNTSWIRTIVNAKTIVARTVTFSADRGVSICGIFPALWQPDLYGLSGCSHLSPCEASGQCRSGLLKAKGQDGQRSKKQK